MSITPNEIFEMEFRTRFRGYDPEEVRNFLETVAREFATIVKERNLLKDHIVKMKGQLDDFKQKNEEFRLALTSAHNISEEMKKQSSREAELIIERAKLDAEKIIGEAHNDAIRLDERIRHLRHLHRDTFLKIRTQLESFLEMLEEESILKLEAHQKLDLFPEKESKLIHEKTSPPEAKLDEPFHSEQEGEKGLVKEEVSIMETKAKTDYDIDLIASEIGTLGEDIDISLKESTKEKDFFALKEEIKDINEDKSS